MLACASFFTKKILPFVSICKILGLAGMYFLQKFNIIQQVGHTSLS